MISSGPKDSRILILGEAPGQQEEIVGKPFIGPSGNLLDSLLGKVGISRSQCFITNVTSERPPNNDIKHFFMTKAAATAAKLEPVLGKYPTAPIREGLGEVERWAALSRPSVTIALGNTALWAATGHTGIDAWRGSVLPCRWGGICIPTYHPAFVLRQWDLGFLLEHDLGRAKQAIEGKLSLEGPPKRIVVRPTFSKVMDFIQHPNEYRHIVADIETRGGEIACLGLAFSSTVALSIPFNSLQRPEGYWTAEEETQIVLALRELLTKNKVIFHNGLFDCQYIAKQWGFSPNVTDDTMIAQNVAFPGMKKSLSFMASLYCDWYSYWKTMADDEDGKVWRAKSYDEDKFWHYNALDCIYTFEVWEKVTKALSKFGLLDQYRFQMELFQPVLEMMFRGINVDLEYQKWMKKELGVQMKKREKWFEAVLGHKLNCRSHPQMKALFYEDFQCKPIISRKTKTPTLDDEALKTIKKRYPLLEPLINGVEEYRSMGTFRSTFGEMQAGNDGRMRCSFNIAGTETTRFSSSEDAFGEGGNLENIPRPPETEMEMVHE